jgi:hypothetical protein
LTEKSIREDCRSPRRAHARSLTSR